MASSQTHTTTGVDGETAEEMQTRCEDETDNIQRLEKRRKKTDRGRLICEAIHESKRENCAEGFKTPCEFLVTCHKKEG